MLHSKVTGEGENVIVFIHGNSQSLHTWDDVVSDEKLSNYKLVAVDLPGCGQSFRSTQPEADYSLKGLGANLGEFLKAYQDDAIILVGNSLGTNAIAEVTPFPANCKGVFLTGAMIVDIGMELTDAAQPNPAVAASFDPYPSDQLLNDAIASILPDADAEVLAKYKNEFLNADPNLRAYLGQSVVQKQWSDEITGLNNAGIPVAVFYGEQENVVKTDYLDSTPLKKWRDRIFMVPGGGHCMHIDQPDTLAAYIAEFAAECFK